MELDFLQPLSNDIVDFVDILSSQHLGSKVVLHTDSQFPDLDKIRIAIIGVLENRGDKNAVSKVDLTPIRKEFYSLFPGNWDVSIADLGDILAGEAISDTYFALKKVVAGLIKKRIIPIVIGGSQDLTYSLYRAFDELEQTVNLVTIDSKFDFGQHDAGLHDNSYLSK